MSRGPGLVDTAAGTIEIADFGPSRGEAVILLHHGFGTWASLIALGRRLAALLPGHRFVCYSRPGCGMSPPHAAPRTPDYLLVEARDVLPAVVEAVSPGGGYNLVGHSDGGSIALLAAALRPDAVRSVTAIAPHVIVEQRTIDGIRALSRLEGCEGWRARLHRRHADVQSAYFAWRDLWLGREMRDWSITDKLGAIACPLLIIQGEQDEFGTFHQLDLIEAAVRGRVSRLELQGVGHQPHRDCLDVVAEACFRHIRGVR